MSVVSDLLRNRVGALLDVRISDATTPSIDQVNNWMYEGAMVLCKIIPIGQLATMMNIETSTETTDWDINELDMIKLAVVQKADKQCRIYAYDDFLHVRDNLPSLHTDNSPACSLSSNAAGAAVLKFLPETSATVSVLYVASPAPIVEWEPATVAPHLVPPDTWAELIVDYAVMKGKIQDEEEQAASMLYQMWTATVQAFIGTTVLGTDAE